MLSDIRQEVLEEDLQPVQAAELLTKATALYASVLEEVARRKMAYNVKEASYIELETAAKAKVLARATEQYGLMLESENLAEATIQLINSLKVLARLKAEEARLG
jgi:hypothetical protein